MNLTVHAIMYTYYGFRALRFNIPKWVNIFITSSQILQMVVGVYINVSAFLIKRRGETYCDISDQNLNFAFTMYLSYFVLFFNFFYHSYISPKKKTNDNQANGHANGHINGHVNGHANGHLNGHANGFVNGHVNRNINHEEDSINNHLNNLIKNHED
jgi:hypothetical protein